MRYDKGGSEKKFGMFGYGALDLGIGFGTPMDKTPLR